MFCSFHVLLFQRPFLSEILLDMNESIQFPSSHWITHISLGLSSWCIVSCTEVLESKGLRRWGSGFPSILQSHFFYLESWLLSCFCPRPCLDVLKWLRGLLLTYSSSDLKGGCAYPNGRSCVPACAGMPCGVPLLMGRWTLGRNGSCHSSLELQSNAVTEQHSSLEMAWLTAEKMDFSTWSATSLPARSSIAEAGRCH